MIKPFSTSSSKLFLSAFALLMSLVLFASTSLHLLTNNIVYSSSSSEDHFIILHYIVKPVPENGFIVVEMLRNTSNHAKLLAMFFKNASVSITIDLGKKIVNFSVSMDHGFVAEYRYEVSKSRPVIRIERVIERNASFSYSRTYHLDTKTMLLVDEDGKWVGPFPYLARVDPRKPVVQILYLNPVTVMGCIVPEKDRGVVEELLRSIGIELTVIDLSKEQNVSVTIHTKRGNLTIIVPGGGEHALFVKECKSFGLYSVVLDPRAPVKDYRFGNLSIPAHRLVRARFIYSKKDINATITRIDGVAIGFGNESTYLAMKIDILPEPFCVACRQFVGNVSGILLQGVLGLVPLTTDLVYDVDGFLVNGTISLPSSSAAIHAVLAPTFDLTNFLGLVGLPSMILNASYALDIANASTVRVYLVNAVGLHLENTITVGGPSTDRDIAILVVIIAISIPIALLLTRGRRGA